MSFNASRFVKILFLNILSFKISGKKLSGALLLGMLNHLMGVARLHYHAVIHENQLICHIPGKCHLMGYDNHGGLLLCQSADNFQYLSRQLRV